MQKSTVFSWDSLSRLRLPTVKEATRMPYVPRFFSLLIFPNKYVFEYASGKTLSRHIIEQIFKLFSV